MTLPLWHIDAVSGGGVHPIAYGSRTRLELGGVNVELHYLMNYPGLQTKRNAVFWEAYFEKAGARLAEVRTLEG